MEDESIISSPKKLNRSIHRSRLHRKNRILNCTYTKTKGNASIDGGDEDNEVLPNNANYEDLSSTLLIMYDSEKEDTIQDGIKEKHLISHEAKPRFVLDKNFDPFAEQRLLVLADRFAAAAVTPPPRAGNSYFKATQGFQTSDKFLFQAQELNSLRAEDTSLSEKVDKFEITDSELLQICEENEKPSKVKNSHAEDSGGNVCRMEDLEPIIGLKPYTIPGVVFPSLKQEQQQQQAQSADVNKSPTTPKVEKKSKSIVDLILEDFCSSPASPDLQQSSEESNFHFKFANKPLRTYSRKRPTHENVLARKNIAEQYLQSSKSGTRTNFAINDDDDILSNGSSTDLSVQEDQTQIHRVTNPPEMVDLQSSQHLYENLKNLSAYFTQLSGEQDRNQDLAEEESNLQVERKSGSSLDLSHAKANASNEQENEKETNIITAEALESPKKYRTSLDDKISIEEEFKGFASEDENAGAEMTAAQNQNCDIIETRANALTDLDDDNEWNDECDFLANFDMDELDTAYKVEKRETLDELNCFQTAADKTEITHAQTEEHAKRVPQVSPSTFGSGNVKDARNKDWEQTNYSNNGTNTNTIEDGCLEKATKFETAVGEKNVRMAQAAGSFEQHNEMPTTSASLQKKPFVGFQTASHKAIKVSKEAQEQADKLLQHLPELNVKEEEQKTTKVTATIETPSTSGFGGFRTASSKTIQVSKEAKERAASLLKDIAELNAEEDGLSTTKATAVLAPASTSGFGGFRTASSKTIQVSKAAQERADLLLRDITDLSAANVDTNPRECLEDMQLSEWPVDDEMESHVHSTVKCKAEQLHGCETKNHKVITQHRSSNQPDNAFHFLHTPQISEEKCMQQQNIDFSALPGFSTASRKTIFISEAAQQRAAAILDELPALPVEFPDETVHDDEQKRSVTETLENVVFSEWPFAEDAPANMEACQLEQQERECHKRKWQHAEMEKPEIGAEPCSPPQRSPKMLCKSPPTAQRSPLAHIQPINARSSLSELAVKTPPDYRAACGVIARKNLLSLNKRNKLHARSLQQSNDEFKVGGDGSDGGDASTARTPTKMNAAPAPQTTPDTPTLNLKEFFASASISTSTPHPQSRQHQTASPLPLQMRTRARKRAEEMKAATSNTLSTPKNDSSLKRIDWNEEGLNRSATSPASTFNASKLSNASLSNITKMSSNPTPKQRIARLRMYGKPPSVSPIHMSSTNNCRTSGLKRLNRSVGKDVKE